MSLENRRICHLKTVVYVTWNTPTTAHFHQWLAACSRQQVLLPGICRQLFQ